MTSQFLQIESTMEEISRSQRKKKRTLDKIVKASYEVFSSRGLSQATLEEIAETADIGKGTLYGHFESKMHLIVYLVRHSTDELIDSMKIRVQETGNLPDRIKLLIQGQLQFFRNNQGAFKLLFFARALVKQKSNDPLVEEIRQEFKRFIFFLRESFNGSLKSGEAGIPPEELAAAVAGLASGAFSFWLVEGNGHDLEKRSDLLANLILSGITIKSSEPASKS